MKPSNEAFWWSLFSAGGVLAALFVPGMIIATGFLLPTAEQPAAVERYQQVHALASFWPVRLLLGVVIFLTLFHCAHRIRHTLMDLGLRRHDVILKAVCYCGALAGTMVAIVILIKL